MSYLTFHHKSLYFQIRVPIGLRSRYGSVIRVNLQTTDTGVAKALALRLASEWLGTFHAAQAGIDTDAMLAVGPGIGENCADAVIDRPESGPLESHSTQRCPSAMLNDADFFDAWRRIDRERDEGTVREMRNAIRDLRRFTKEPLTKLTRLDISGYRDELLTRSLARATIAKRVGFVSALLQVGFDAGMLPQNVARGLKIPRAKVPTLVRRSFTTVELGRLFSSPVFARGMRPLGGGGEACFWMPMIALATGARLEEIAQLRTDDILLDPLHGPLMRITDEGDGQRVKTEGSRRVVPLHPELIHAGFLDYWGDISDSGAPRLFPLLELDHDGRRGGNFGKWFQRYLRSRAGAAVTDPRVVFHSFRHTFKTLCRAARISEEVHDALTGHVSDSVSRRYGEMPVGPLVDAIGLIQMPIELPRIATGEGR